MARSRDTSDDAYSKVRSNGGRKRRFSRLRLMGIGLLVFCVGLILAVPFVASNAGLATSLINRFAGVDPLTVQLKSVSIGWFSPLKLENLRVLDERGTELLQVGEIETQLSIWSLMTNYTDLRTVYIRQTKVSVDVQPNMTSLEEALKPILAKYATPEDTTVEVPDDSGAPASEFTGTIQIENAAVLARDSVTNEQWEFSITDAVIPLPSSNVPVPEIEINGRVAQVDATGSLILKSTGQFQAIVASTKNDQSLLATVPNSPSSSMHVTLATNGMPLEWISLVKRRLGDLPIDAMTGSATMQADIDVQSLDNLMIRIATAQVDQLQVRSASLLGAQGAALKQVRLVGNIAMNGSTLKADQLQLTSDFGYLRANARTSLPPNIPSLAQPWVKDAEFAIDGELDLAKLTQVAPDLIAMRDQTRLTSGKATLTVRQLAASSPEQVPNVDCNVRLGSLQAEINGSKMQWEEALQLRAEVVPSEASSQAAEFKMNCIAEFCDIVGRGTLNQGQLSAKIDLDKLENRLSQWIQLPTESLAGSANAKLVWNQQGQDRVVASATVDSSPLSIVLANGKIEEPAWKGTATTSMQISELELIQLDHASLKMQSEMEAVDINITSPLRLAAMPAGSPSLPATNLSARFKADLGSCTNRCRVFAALDLGMAMAGICDVQVDGTIQNMMPTLSNATYDVTGLRIKGDGYSVNENRVQGNFKGHIDPMNIAAMRVEEMVVQAESFALSARDAAASQPDYLRNGQAAFRIDPNRLMRSIQTGDGSVPSNLVYRGDVTGQMQWLLNAKQIDWQVSLDGKNVAVDQMPNNAMSPTTLVSASSIPNTAAATNLWEEPQVKADVRGSYAFESGVLDIPMATLQSEWMAFAGKTNYTPGKSDTVIKCDGQLTYDMQAVTQRMKPWIGDYVKATGQKSGPIEFTWRARNDGSGTWADSLSAKTDIGWDQVDIVGIALGTGSVPMTIDHGVLKTATEIPVSQGTVRWDVTSNLANEPLMIIQKPQTVLDHVAITPQMCQGWLKYVAPILSNVAAIQGQLSLEVERAEILPLDLNNQTVSGKLHIHGASVGPGPLADQLIGIARQIRSLRKGITADAATVNDDLWLQMPEQKIAFNVERGLISHKDLKLKIGDVVINTSGGARLDGSLQMMASVPIVPEWVSENQYLASLAGKTIDLPIVGTLQQPRVDFSVMTTISQQLISSAAQKAVQTQVDRGLNKLLGPIQNQLQPLQNQIQSLPSQLPQLPQLPNLGIPGFGK